MIGLLAGVAVVGILVWIFGAGIFRFVGIVLVIDGLGGIALGHMDNPRFAIELAVGLGLWLAGTWLFAAKHGLWSSRLARRVWTLPVLGVLSPIRG
jgi:hypothetical protein